MKKGQTGCATIVIFMILVLFLFVSMGMSVGVSLLVIGIAMVGLVIWVLVKSYDKKKYSTATSRNATHNPPQLQASLNNKLTKTNHTVNKVNTYPVHNKLDSIPANVSEYNQRKEFEKILLDNNVATDYKKIFIANSRFYQILDSPAIIWKDLNDICILVLEKKPKIIHLKRSWIKIVKYTSPNIYNNINANYFSDFVKEEFKDYYLDSNFDYQIVKTNIASNITYIELNEKSAYNVLELLGISCDPGPVIFSNGSKQFAELNQIILPEAKETESHGNTCIDYSKLIEVPKNILKNYEKELSDTKDEFKLPVINLSKPDQLDINKNTLQRYNLILKSYEQQFFDLDKFEDVIYAYTRKSGIKELNNALNIRALSYYLFKNEITRNRISESELISYISKKVTPSDNDVDKGSELVQASNYARIDNLNTLKINLAEQKSIANETQKVISEDEKNNPKLQPTISKNFVAEFELPNIESTKTFYSSEPIQQSLKVDLLISDRYKLMKQIDPKSEYEWDHSTDQTKQFYQQAKFMEFFEDTYNNNIEFMHYQPKYIDMTLDQLRWYFTWRAKVRKGEVVQTSLSYMYVYVYELLNQIGTNNCEDALNKLIDFWNQYRVDNVHLDRYLPTWIHDYILYQGCNIKLLETLPHLKEHQTSYKLMAIADAINNIHYDGFAELLNDSSFYKILRSKFFNSQYGYTVNEALSYIMVELKEFYAKSRKTLLITKLIGKPMGSTWRPFRSAVVFEWQKPKYCDIVLNDFEEYQFENGRWTTINYYNVDSQFIGQILRTTEMYLREYLDYPRKIKIQTIPKELDKIIKDSVQKYCTENEKEGLVKRQKENSKTKELNNNVDERHSLPSEIIIDTSKFNEIRSSSNMIQKKLVVEDCEDEINIPDSIYSEEVSAIMYSHDLNKTTDDWHTLSSSLSDMHLKILRVLINSENVSQLLSEISTYSNLLLEVLFEQINEKALDFIGDNIIEGNNVTPYIYDDYIENVKNMLEEIEYNAK